VCFVVGPVTGIKTPNTLLPTFQKYKKTQKN